MIEVNERREGILVVNNLVDLFSGGGGMTRGAIDAGLEVSAALELWQPALDSYGANFSHDAIRQDLSDLKKSVQIIKDLNPRIIAGGPPCQDFSNAGNRQEGDRAQLTSAFANIVAEIKPDAFVMENVPSAAKSQAYAEAQETFRRAGYSLSALTLDASYFGVPQKRKRLLVVGFKDSDSVGVNEFFERDLLSQQTMTPLTVKRNSPEIDVEHYYRHPRSYSRRAVFSTNEPSPTIRGTNRPRPKSYTPHPSDSSSASDIRALSISERSAIQSFTKDHKWQGSKTEIEQMIGNAIPPSLAKHVLRSVTTALNANIAIATDDSDRTREIDLASARRLVKLNPYDANEEPFGYAKRLCGIIENTKMAQSQMDRLKKTIMMHATAATLM